MVDIFSKRKRSAIMRKIGPKNSMQEMYIRKIIFSMGYRFRLHRKDLPGKPDIVFPKYKKVIFVHGCFWHGHKNCIRAAVPLTNRVFWKKKISSNSVRDKQNFYKLKKLGWRYLIVWQCRIKKKKEFYLKRKIYFFLNSEKTNDSGKY